MTVLTSLEPPDAHACDPESERSGAALRRAGPELAIIVPTFNEVENVDRLIERLHATLDGLSWEVVFVDDDSPDHTAERVRAHGHRDSRVRCLQRVGRRGLSSACIEGMLATSAPYLAVIDADLQHDERLLPQMLALIRQGSLDIVIGSRYAGGGNLGDLDARRVRLSRLATRVSRLLVPASLTDPMSGFFMLRREAFDASIRRLSALGFKLLVDLFASSPRPLRFRELPYRFRARTAGVSKLDSAVMWDYGLLLIDKLVGHIVPARFVAFALVGVLGVAVHFLTLTLVFEWLHRSFTTGQALATTVAMIFNFWVNNRFTYGDVRLRGWRWVRGCLSFMAVCGIGALANVGVASYLFRWNTAWVPAALAGIVVSSVWNFVATSIFTWARPGRR
jgi:dolichol-phosphate mannosyltransferase